jgi:hypothetical protein
MYAQGGYPTAAPRNGMGTAALVLGIIALLSCWTVLGGLLLGALALIFGIIGRRRANRHQATNGGAALAGAILGGLALAVSILILAVAGVFLINHKEEFKNYRDCVAHANTGSERQQCSDDFNRSVTR